MNTTTLDRLRRDHRNLERLLTRVEGQLEVLERGEAPDFAGTASIVGCLTNDPARYHHPLEDLLLARLEHRDPPSAEAIGHRQYRQQRLAARGRVLLDRLRDVSAGQPVSRAQLLEPVRRFHWGRNAPAAAPPEQPPAVPNRFNHGTRSAPAGDDGFCPLCAAS
ncbi:hypothetical protein QWY84_19800 [Aquisalimonas lutea]|uniref:hemerythrin domain-containing protein n=1 Tax=Aquisalimonas lutea TaxID=1327750 RepID=UPI0025B3CD82|nr:hypothetical protein [Aquisalimonas lutea]MDN3519853.1 hypothetical protein [Aquisalimonas lutea]